MQLLWEFHDSHTRANEGTILCFKNCWNIIKITLKLISVATTFIIRYSGVAVMSPVLQTWGTGFESRRIHKDMGQIKVHFILANAMKECISTIFRNYFWGWGSMIFLMQFDSTWRQFWRRFVHSLPKETQHLVQELPWTKSCDRGSLLYFKPYIKPQLPFEPLGLLTLNWGHGSSWTKFCVSFGGECIIHDVLKSWHVFFSIWVNTLEKRNRICLFWFGITFALDWTKDSNPNPSHYQKATNPIPCPISNRIIFLECTCMFIAPYEGNFCQLVRFWHIIKRLWLCRVFACHEFKKYVG